MLNFSNFGGEIPRASAQALPADAAQVNQNLLATSTEFRPLSADTTITTGLDGAKTLYRLSRNADGTLRTNDPAGDATGWIAEAADKSYVKGQINDDATDRTYVTFNDGTQAPRAIDATGANRLIGVPAPVWMSAALAPVASFTASEGADWAVSVLAPAIVSATLASSELDNVLARVNPAATGSIAGPYSFRGLSWVNPGDTDVWNLRYTISLSNPNAAGLLDPKIGPDTATTPGSVVLRITCLPYWGFVNNPGNLLTAIGAIVNPKTGTPLFTGADPAAIRDELATRLSPDTDTIKTQRTLLDATLRDFKAAVDFVLTPPGTAPTAPAKPTVAEYITTYTGGESGTSETIRDALWVAYDAAYVTYQAADTAFASTESAIATQKAARISEIAQLQAKALRISTEIERQGAAQRDTLREWVGSLVNARGLNKTATNPGGLVALDADRIVDTRFYLTTFVSDWGEESAPSPTAPMAGVLDVDQYASVTVTRATIPADRAITKWRIYRTNAGSLTSEFQFVAEVDAAIVTYSDAKKGSELGEVCPSTTWLEPPIRRDAAGAPQGSNPYLRGLVDMPNGVMAGFVDNNVAFCDPYHPYAWPAEYQIALAYPVTGLGVFGQTLFVGTLANPYLISGSDPASMSAVRMDDAQACVSSRSIASVGGGVLYASPDGLCLASGNGVEVVTRGLFSREDWQALQPYSMFAAVHEGVYYFWYEGSGFGCYGFDAATRKLGRVDLPASAVFADSLTDALFFCQGNAIRKAFATGRRVGVWRSAKFISAAPTTLAWAQVYGSLSQGVPATLRWYGDGVLRHTETVTDELPHRLPSGRYATHEIEVESASRLTRVTAASSTQELKSV